MLVVIELLFQTSSIFGRLLASDILLLVSQPFSEEIVRFIFLLDDGVEPIQIVISVTLLLFRLLTDFWFVETDAHFKSHITLAGCGVVEHLFLLVRVHVDK